MNSLFNSPKKKNYKKKQKKKEKFKKIAMTYLIMQATEKANKDLKYKQSKKNKKNTIYLDTQDNSEKNYHLMSLINNLIVNPFIRVYLHEFYASF